MERLAAIKSMHESMFKESFPGDKYAQPKILLQNPFILQSLNEAEKKLKSEFSIFIHV